MTPSEITKLRAALARMPRGPYHYSRRYDNLWAYPKSEPGREIIKFVTSEQGSYYELLTPENVTWMLDMAENFFRIMEDDLK